jgi:hypothetical protein
MLTVLITAGLAEILGEFLILNEDLNQQYLLNNKSEKCSVDPVSELTCKLVLNKQIFTRKNFSSFIFYCLSFTMMLFPVRIADLIALFLFTS